MAGPCIPQNVDATLPKALLFHLQRDEIKASYSIQLQSDGLGTYWEGPPYFSKEEAVGGRVITAGAVTLNRIFSSVDAVKSGTCETRAKNIAQTGRKTLVLMDKGAPKCEFNYSDDEKVNDAATAFAAIAETLRMGDKLAHDRRFDHLGLNADMEALSAEAKAGDAIELQNIATVLHSIADNDELMDVVRRKAQSLLQDATLAAPARK